MIFDWNQLAGAEDQQQQHQRDSRADDEQTRS